MATGLTDGNGNFAINPSASFSPSVNDVFILEAGKRIGGNGNAVMTIRTYIKWNGTGWDSMTTPGIFINTKTTALAIAQNFNKGTVSALDTIGKINVSTGNSVPLDIGTFITAQTVMDVSNLVTQVLADNFDPMYYIKFVSGEYRIVVEYPALNPAAANLKPNMTNVTLTGFTANWSAINDCTYDLIVTKVSDNSEVLNQSLGTSTTYNVTALTAGTQYKWKLKAKNTINNLEQYSSEVTIGLLDTPVANSATNIAPISFTANWDATPNATGYKLFVDGVQYHDNTTVINTNSYNVTGITKLSIHNYYVVALNSYNASPNSNTVSFSNAIVTTIAGSTLGYLDATGTNALFNSPYGAATDSSDNVYVSDYGNNRIRKIDSTGVVTTFAGSGTGGSLDGTGTNAQFYHPNGVAVDSSGNVYVADKINNRIRKITSAGEVTTFAGSTCGTADGTGTNAQLCNLYGITIDTSGNLYVTDNGNNTIRKITPAGDVTTLAGDSIFGSGYADGTGTNAHFNKPQGVAVDTSGNVYIADTNNYRIRKITSGGVVTTFAGSSTYGYADGIGTNAQFYNPQGVATDLAGNVYVANLGSIRKITPAGVVTTIAGSTPGYADGTGTNAKFNGPYGLATDSSGNIYVADTNNHRIRKIE